MQIRLFIILLLICTSPLLLLSSRPVQTVELLPDQEKSISLNLEGSNLIINVPNGATVMYNMTLLTIEGEKVLATQSEIIDGATISTDGVGIYKLDFLSTQFVIIEIDVEGINQPMLIFSGILLLFSLILYRKDILNLFTS